MGILAMMPTRENPREYQMSCIPRLRSIPNVAKNELVETFITGNPGLDGSKRQKDEPG